MLQFLLLSAVSASNVPKAGSITPDVVISDNAALTATAADGSAAVVAPGVSYVLDDSLLGKLVRNPMEKNLGLFLQVLNEAFPLIRDYVGHVIPFNLVSKPLGLINYELDFYRVIELSKSQSLRFLAEPVYRDKFTGAIHLTFDHLPYITNAAEDLIIDPEFVKIQKQATKIHLGGPVAENAGMRFFDLNLLSQIEGFRFDKYTVNLNLDEYLPSRIENILFMLKFDIQWVSLDGFVTSIYWIDFMNLAIETNKQSSISFFVSRLQTHNQLATKLAQFKQVDLFLHVCVGTELELELELCSDFIDEVESFYRAKTTTAANISRVAISVSTDDRELLQRVLNLRPDSLILTNPDVATLESLSSLLLASPQTLTVSLCFNDEDKVSFSEAEIASLSEVKELNVIAKVSSGNTGLFTSLARLRNLMNLSLSGNGITGAMLSRMTQIERLVIVGEFNAMEQVMKMSNIKDIALFHYARTPSETGLKFGDVDVHMGFFSGVGIFKVFRYLRMTKENHVDLETRQNVQALRRKNVQALRITPF